MILGLNAWWVLATAIAIALTGLAICQPFRSRDRYRRRH